MSGSDSWPPWPRNNEKMLARYVNPEAAKQAVEAREPGFFGLASAESPFTSFYDLVANKRYQAAVRALYDPLCRLDIEYDYEPLPVEDPTHIKQVIRRPAEVVPPKPRHGRGTCLDLALLFAGLCLEVRLLPMVALLRNAGQGVDHALVVVDTHYSADQWNQPRGLKEEYREEGLIPGKEGGQFVRERIAQGKWMALECTGFAKTLTAGRATPLLSFEAACAEAVRHLEQMEHRVTVDVYLLQQGRGETPFRLSVLPPERSVPASNPPVQPSYSGRTKLAFCQRLGDDWRKLATYLEIPPYDQAPFKKGDEGQAIWVWLENRRQLGRLPEALVAIGRPDLAELFTGAP